MKLSQINRLKGALRWAKTGIIMSIMIHSIMMVDTVFHNLGEIRTISLLPGFWLAIIIPLIFIIWIRISPAIMKKIGIIHCCFITFTLIAIMLVILRVAMNPITNTTIWVSSTLYFAHKTYPPYLNNMGKLLRALRSTYLHG